MLPALATLLLLAAAAPDWEAARTVLRSASCDKCHDSVLPTAKPGALAVFDLRQEAWPARMSDQQLPKLMGRLGRASKADRQIVQQLIDAELRMRHAAK